MVRRARAVCPARACARALSGTVSQAFPRIEQGQLTLLGIQGFLIKNLLKISI